MIYRKMVSFLLALCMVAGCLACYSPVEEVRADDDMYTFTYVNDNGDTVTVSVSNVANPNYVAFDYGFDTRGGYVRAEIDPTGNGDELEYINCWLNEDGPNGDGTAYDPVKAASCMQTAGEGFSAYGNVKKSMFWFNEEE